MAPINIDAVRNGLKGEKGDSNGQQNSIENETGTHSIVGPKRELVDYF